MTSKQQLIEDNLNLVYAVVNRHYPQLSLDEDIIQCGMIGLCKAANKWDESKGKFSTFAYACIRNDIRNELRNRSRHPRPLSLDVKITGGSNEGDTFVDQIVGDQDVDYFDLDDIVKDFSPRDKEIVKLSAKGMTTREIAKVIGVSRETVSKVNRKLKRILNDTEEY